MKSAQNKKSQVIEVQIGSWMNKACVFELIDVEEYGTGPFYISPEELLQLSSSDSQIKLTPVPPAKVIQKKQLKEKTCSYIGAKYQVKENEIKRHFNTPPFAQDRENKIKNGSLKCLVPVDPKCPPFRLPDEEEPEPSPENAKQEESSNGFY